MRSEIPLKKIFLRPTRVTPFIYFNQEQGILEIHGRSSPENAISFYKNIKDGLSQFAKMERDSFTASFALEYFNTSSSKCLFDIFKELIKIEKSGKKISINWFYSEFDNDMMEAGEDYSDLLDLNFNFIEIEE